jgi:ankyrin repeat protein
MLLLQLADGYTGLHFASYYGHTEVVSKLVDARAYLEARDFVRSAAAAGRW